VIEENWKEDRYITYRVVFTHTSRECQSDMSCLSVKEQHAVIYTKFIDQLIISLFSMLTHTQVTMLSTFISSMMKRVIGGLKKQREEDEMLLALLETEQGGYEWRGGDAI
jgi:hypothetical protein